MALSSNQQQSNTPEDLKILVELYKIVVEEYRFQVNLNWDRNKFYVLLNSGLISANCGLLRLPGFKFAEFLTIPLFVLGFLTAWLGYKTLTKGVEYRRRATIKKAQIEEKLSAYSSVIPIETTVGMREVKKIINSEDELTKYVTKSPRIGTINYFLILLFVSLMIVNLGVLIYLAYSLLKLIS